MIHKGALPLPWLLDQPVRVIAELYARTNEILDEAEHAEE